MNQKLLSFSFYYIINMVVKMIKKNKKLLLSIIDPNGTIEPSYFTIETNQQHCAILRNYIRNKSNDQNLKDDLEWIDKMAPRNKLIETRLNVLVQLFIKNGYMILVDATDYRNAYQINTKHKGWIYLPSDIENLTLPHKQALNFLSNEIVVDRSYGKKPLDPNKITYSWLKVGHYENNEFIELGEFDQVMEHINQNFKTR